MTLAEMNWAKGYVQEARYLRSLATFADTWHASAIYGDEGQIEGVKDVKSDRPVRGWSDGKKSVKTLIHCWAIPHCMTLGDAQKGMVDAILDSVGC